MKREWARLVHAFGYALRGLGYLIRTQPNARWHAVATVVVVLLAGWLRVSPLEAGLLVLAVGFVWAAEAFNTALEALADRCAPEPHPLVAAAKDTAAAGVLVAALTALAVAGWVLFPRLVART